MPDSDCFIYINSFNLPSLWLGTILQIRKQRYFTGKEIEAQRGEIGNNLYLYRNVHIFVVENTHNLYKKIQNGVQIIEGSIFLQTLRNIISGKPNMFG